jgi:glycosyltransferase involved in cell wall biosynthesis
MKKILFFTPYGERTGSEMLLWNILKGFDRHLFQAQLICEQSGELLNSMPADVKSYSLNYSLLEKAIFKVSTIKKSNENFSPIAAYINQITSIHNRFQPDYWYLNTIVMAKMIPLARRLGVKVISHFHELPPSYQTIRENQLKDLIEYSTAIIGCSEIVCEKIRILGHRNIYLQHEFIDNSKITTRNDKKKQIRQELNIADDDFVWGLSATRTNNKGIDLLPEIAKSFSNKKAHFIWLGGGNSGLFYYAKKQIEYYGIENVHFLGALKEDYYDYLAVADAFLLLSRSDSFPLVMIEAAYLGKPIIAFNSGGVNEFVLEGMGAIVDSWNICDLINEMNKLMSGAIKIDTDIIKERATEFCVSKQMIHWQNIINSIISHNNGDSRRSV